MGTQGFSGRAVFGGQGGDRAPWRRVTILAVSLAVLPLAAGCSGSSLPSFGSSQPQAASVPPPPGAPAGQQAYAPPPGQPGNQPASYAAAPPPAQAAESSDGATVGSFKSSYVGFLKAFRDPDPEPAGYDARASVYPQQSLADTFKGSADANQRPDPGGAGYPQQSLIRSPSANPPQQNAYIPHPPSTYVPSGQPYTPPQGQAAYAQSADQQNSAAPPAQPDASRTAQQSSAASSAKKAKAARPSSQQNAAAPPPAPAAYAAPAAAPAPAAPPAQQDYSDSMPYPKQSLADVFRGSTEPQTQTVPRPPSTYTASGQPYTPQGQAANGAPAGGAAAAPPASQDPSNSLPYPKQSLFEVFSNK
jgi:hypothetical protein